MLELIKNSLRMRPGIRSCWEEDMYEFSYDVSETAAKFDHCYSIHNAIVAFNVDGEMYVVPYDIPVLETLRQNGFPEKEFFVPFSHKDYPVGKKDEWLAIRRRAEAKMRSGTFK